MAQSVKSFLASLPFRLGMNVIVIVASFVDGELIRCFASYPHGRHIRRLRVHTAEEHSRPSLDVRRNAIVTIETVDSLLTNGEASERAVYTVPFENEVNRGLADECPRAFMLLNEGCHNVVLESAYTILPGKRVQPWKFHATSLVTLAIRSYSTGTWSSVNGFLRWQQLARVKPYHEQLESTRKDRRKLNLLLIMPEMGTEPSRLLAENTSVDEDGCLGFAAYDSDGTT